jgi:rhamnose utilization protein RhaD (predicted bifunctional aldolase and dehydrogenase)
MDHKTQILQNLVQMSRNIGSPEKDYVILGDGNSSARIDEHSFWIKASGARMEKIQPGQFVELRTSSVLKMLDYDSLSDMEIARLLAEAKSDPSQPPPSIESILHALAIEVCGALYIGHTHPTAWVGILSSQNVEQAISGRIFTEQINICGPAALFVHYADPGLPLARQVSNRMRAYITKYGEPPKEILLQNHGLFALGMTPSEVENITAMSVRAARALQISFTFGGPRFLSDKDIERIRSRPDEVLRRQQANRQ